MVSIGEALMQGGCDIIGLFLCNCINRGALLQEGCDIIGLLYNGVNRRGSYAGRLLYYWPFI